MITTTTVRASALAGIALLLAGTAACAPATETLRSPSGTIVIAFRLAPGGVPEWRVDRKGSPVLEWSRLGLEFAGGVDAGSHFVIEKTSTAHHDEWYNLVAGKTRRAHDRHTELAVTLRRDAPPDSRLVITFRAFDDGAAFRYTIPAGGGGDSIDITAEKTEFTFPEDMSAWAFQINTFHSSFEGHYLPTTLGAIPDTGEVYLPLTMQRHDGLTVAVTEADLTDYAGMYVRGMKPLGLRVVLPPYPDTSGACVHARAPFSSPWRVLMIGERPGDLIASTIIYDLSAPCTISDVSWIKPGKAIFPWWPDFYCDMPGIPSKLTFENQKYYIDFAAENGFSYLELEPPWYGDTDDCIAHPRDHDITKPVPELRLPELLAYAASKGIRLFIWAHCDNVARQGDSAFALYRKWGAAGVKIDFMNRDDQQIIRWEVATLKKAAAYHLMVLYHGMSKPTGLQRTYPHLLSQEGVFGNEQNKVTREVTPAHTVTIPFTRMLAGPMDFTPGGFRNATEAGFRPDYSRPMVMGTRSHQMAMFVVYESPLSMVCDDPAAYRGKPEFKFIRDVPVTWDETRVLEGEIGRSIIIARRSGRDWYIGGMTDWTPREFTVPLTFLGEGRFDAEIYSDGADAGQHPTSVSITRGVKTAKDSLAIRMAAGGGITVRFHNVR